MDAVERSLEDGSLVLRVAHAPEEFAIAAEGELDLASAPSLERELRAAAESDARSIVLDLSRLDFIDSTGLALLVAASRRLAAQAGRLAVRAGSGQVAQVMSITGVDRICRVVG